MKTTKKRKKKRDVVGRVFDAFAKAGAEEQEFEAWWAEYAGAVAGTKYVLGIRAVARDAWHAGRVKFAEML